MSDGPAGEAWERGLKRIERGERFYNIQKQEQNVVEQLRREFRKRLALKAQRRQTKLRD